MASLHRVFAELVRVSRHRILISLPNCWTAARKPLVRGRGSIGHAGAFLNLASGQAVPIALPKPEAVR